MKNFIIFLAFMFASSLFAQEFAVFTGLGGDKSWNNPKNWSTNKVPGENDEAYIPSDKGAELDINCRIKKLTIEGGLTTNWMSVGSKLYTDQLIIKKEGTIWLQKGLQILPNTNQLHIENEGRIFTDMNFTANRLIIGDHSPSSNVTMNISGGEIDNADFQFNGNVLEMSGAYVSGFVNIRTDFMSMSNESAIANYSGKTTEESSVYIYCKKSFLLDKGSQIQCNRVPSIETGGNVNIFASTFTNYGTLLPGIGHKKNGKVDIRAQHLFNHGNIGGGSGSGLALGKKSEIQEIDFSNVILHADSVVFAMQDSMIIADTLRVYGKNIIVAIQREAGIGLYNGIEFYNTEDGTIDFTQTKVTNAIAGGYSKLIYSNNVIPSEQWKLQMIFMSTVTVLSADTTLSNACALLTTGYGFANTIDTLRLFLQNLSMAKQSIHYEIHTKLGWVAPLTDSTAVLAPFSTDSMQIPFHIPPETIRGTEDTVQVRISINGIIIDTIYATITCLSRSTNPGELSSISVSPSEVNLSVGQNLQFTAVGLTADADTLHYFQPVWSATGGEIDSMGLYSATQTGDFFIICADTTSGKSDSASVHVLTTGFESDNQLIQTRFVLNNNYPNPFNSTTTISFTLSKTEYATLKVLDLLGNEVKTLVNTELNAGKHSFIFDAKDLPSGVYFYQLKTNSFCVSELMEHIK